MIKNIRFILIVVSLVISMKLISQDRFNIVTSCADSLLTSIAGYNYKEISKNEYEKFELLTKPAVSNWLNMVTSDDLKVLRKVGDDSNLFVFISRSQLATGLAVNLWYYLVVDSKSSLQMEFESLHFSPRSIYSISEGNIIKFIRFKYSDSFTRYRDWDKLAFKAEYCTYNSKKIKLERVEENNCN